MLRITVIYLLFAVIKVSLGKTVVEKIDVRLKETQVPEAGVLIYTLPNGNGSTYHVKQDNANVNAHMANVTTDGRILSTESWDFESNSWIEDYYRRGLKRVNFMVSLLDDEAEDSLSFWVRVIVEDVNDVAPVWLNFPKPPEPFVASMKPNSPPSTLVYYLGAKDPDSTADIRFRVLKEEPEGIFKLFEDEGAIKVKTNEPLPEGTEYIMYVEAEDIAAEEKQSTGVAKLSIMSGYRPPLNLFPVINVTIKEDTLPDTRLSSFGVASFIGSRNTFSILENSVPFWIEDDGNGRGANLMLSKPLDRESGKTLYQFTIQAKEDNSEAIRLGDYGENIPLFGYIESQVTVLVEDVNDNAPKLAREYEPVVYENEQPQVIAEIEATDEDDRLSGNGPPFTFSLSPTADESVKKSFSVTTNTTGDGLGIISSLRVFDREEQSSYVLPVVITDAGNPPLSSTSLLTVVIGDVDDNPMQSGHKDITLYSFQSGTFYYKIGRVFVNDPDDWDGKIYKNMSNFEDFDLDENTGQIFQRGTIAPGTYKLTFTVEDPVGITGKVSASATVTVKPVTMEDLSNTVILFLPNITAAEFIKSEFNTNGKVHTNVHLLKESITHDLSSENTTVEVHVYSIKEVVESNAKFLRIAVGVREVAEQAKIMNKEALQQYLENNEQISSVTSIGHGTCSRTQICYTCKPIIPTGYLYSNFIDSNRTSFRGLNTDVKSDCTDEIEITDTDEIDTVKRVALRTAKEEKNIRNAHIMESVITAKYDYIRFSGVLIEYGVGRYKCDMLLNQYTYTLQSLISCEPACNHCDCKSNGCPSNDYGQCSGTDQGFCECGKCWCSPGYEGPSCSFKADNSTCMNNSGEVCSGRGNCYLGECRCEESAGGRYCENNQTELVEQCRSASGEPVCSGRGDCEEGYCRCYTFDDVTFLKYTGTYCECDDLNCPRGTNNEICSGPQHGRCACGVCHCSPGWEGAACECPSNSSDCIEATGGQVCSGKGSCVCGVCQCDETSQGMYCQEDVPYLDRCRFNASMEVCSGKGDCIEGQCECRYVEYGRWRFRQYYTGKYCECDDGACERRNGSVCSGPDHGVCACGTCQCHNGWIGDACECLPSDDSCRDPESGQICSGKGYCLCGECVCNSSMYAEPFCKRRTRLFPPWNY